jgi:hypothetical protein
MRTDTQSPRAAAAWMKAGRFARPAQLALPTCDQVGRQSLQPPATRYPRPGTRDRPGLRRCRPAGGRQSLQPPFIMFCMENL